MTSSNPTSNPSVPFKRPPPRTVEVQRVTRLTPHMLRITLGGEQMTGFATTGVAEHVRVFMPRPDTGVLELPVLGPDGYAFPEGQERPPSRAFTPRRWDPQTNQLDIDVVIHGEGPGSAWASSVKQGDTAVISGQPGGPYQPLTDVDWYLIGGDEAALPAIGTLLEALPASMSAYVFAETLNEDEELEMTSPAQMQIAWLHRNSTEELPGRRLAVAMRNVDLPQGKGCIWVSCEASIMREIRAHFLHNRGLDRSMLRTQGYWKAGAANHPDHDLGDDV